jgi:hypothetical protein
VRRLLQLLAVVAALLLVVGAVLGFARRHEQVDAATTVVLAVGTVLTVAVVVAAGLLERRPDGLVVAEDERLPAPAWWPPVLLAGLADLAGGIPASPPMAVTGIVLVALALLGWGRRLVAPPGPPDRRTVALARRVVAACGRGPAITSTPVGVRGVRVVCTGGGGRVDDVVRGPDEVDRLVALVGAASAD